MSCKRAGTDESVQQLFAGGMRNFILLGDTAELQGRAAEMADYARLRFPEEFNGELSCFLHELRYIPPFERFTELIRLQGTAANKAGFRDEYNGYIIMDISEYLRHESDMYFDISIKFLHDMNQHWRYIFLLDNSSTNAAQELVRKLLSILSCTVIKDKQADTACFTKCVKSMCGQYSLKCTNAAVRCFAHLLQTGCTKQAVSNILCDIAAVSGVINTEVLREYFGDEQSAVRYILTARQLSGAAAMLSNYNKSKGAECYDEKI